VRLPASGPVRPDFYCIQPVFYCCDFINMFMLARLLFFTCILLPSICMLSKAQGIDAGKGTSPSGAEDDTGTVRAVIVGVSDYKNIRKLDYAHRDAQFFGDYLIQRKSIDPRNIEILTDAKATGGDVKEAIRRKLFDEAKPNDIIIIYFAGHGDTDKRLVNDAYLLLHGAHKDGDYDVGETIQISWLQNCIATAIQQNDQLRVFLFVDACRAGKLVDSEEGAQKSIASLLQTWTNTAKLVSCEPNQLSYEGPQWGEGHGVFSYYLIEGLKGAADTNPRDNRIDLRELEKYVSQNVEQATKSRRPRQIPRAAGSSETIVMTVDNRQNVRRAGNKKTVITGLENSRDPDQTGYFVGSYSSQKQLASFRQSLSRKLLLKPVHVPYEQQSLKLSNAISARVNSGVNYRVSYHPGGRDLALYGKDGIRFYDARSLKPYPHPLAASAARMYFSPDGEHLILGSWDNSIKIYAYPALEQINEIAVPDGNVKTMVLSDDGKLAAVGGFGSSIYLVNLVTGTIRSMDTGQEAITSIHFSTDGECLLSGSARGQVSVWNLKSGQPVSSHAKHAGQGVEVVLFSPTGTQAISGAADGNIIIWDYKRNQFQQIGAGTIKEAYKKINDLAVTGDGNYLIRAGNNNFLHVFDVRTGQELGLIANANERGIVAVQLNPADNQLAFTDYGGNVLTAPIQVPLEFAADLYPRLQAQPALDRIDREKIKGSLYIAIHQDAQQVVDPFILGKDIVPPVPQIKEVIRRLDFALVLYKDDQMLSNNLLVKKLFLQAYEIILSNDAPNYNKAIRLVEQIKRIQPTASYPYNTISIIQKKKNELEEAKKSVVAAIERIPRWTEPKSNLGKTYLREGKYDKAIEEFNKIITLNPASSKGYANMSEVHFALGAYRTTEEYLLKAIRLDSLNPVLYDKYGYLELKRGNFSRSENLFRTSIRLDSSYPFSYMHLGELYFQQYLGRKENKALLDSTDFYLKKANALGSVLPETYAARSDYYLNCFRATGSASHIPVVREKGSYVLGFYNQALKLDPFYPQAQAGAGLTVLLLNKDQKGAEDYFANQVKTSPNLAASYYYYYADFLTETGAYAKAEENYKAAIRLDSRSLPAHLGLLTLYISNKDFKKAEQLYERAKTTFKESPDVVLHYAKLMYQAHLGGKETKDLSRPESKIKEMLESELRTIRRIDSKYSFGTAFLQQVKWRLE